MSPHLQPIAPTQRVKEIDFVRGFALLGILLVNMSIFRDSIFGMAIENPTSEGFLSTIANGITYLLAEGKFYSLFSLLFGFGFSIFLLKEQTQHIQMETAFKRRMLGLLGFGLVHAFLIWSGDILITYALLGFMLIAFKNVSVKGLVKWAISLLVFIVAIQLLIFFFMELAKNFPNADFILEQMGNAQTILAEKAAVAREVYSGTDYIAMIAVRGQEIAQQYSGFFIIFPSVLAMFLTGFALGKSGKLRNISENKPFFKKMFWICLLIGLPLAAMHVYGIFTYTRMATDLTGSFHIVGFFLGSPILALAYLSGGLLLFNRFSKSRFLQMVANTGRMALTNYLMQSIICTTIFYGYGFGLSGKVNAFCALIMALAIWLIQLPLSTWWLGHYRFGPAEWLWRWITYGEKQQNRIQ
ncbi:MAG: DUF418 domain-containing protein [Tenuifilaceae bacterium]|jgi:uncharacterized protein|nr:DUF418 domain-containing protein [Tenuifilaceae bacterium]